jgi:hypothetical protein
MFGLDKVAGAVMGGNPLEALTGGLGGGLDFGKIAGGMMGGGDILGGLTKAFSDPSALMGMAANLAGPYAPLAKMAMSALQGGESAEGGEAGMDPEQLASAAMGQEAPFEGADKASLEKFIMQLLAKSQDTSETSETTEEATV